MLLKQASFPCLVHSLVAGQNEWVCPCLSLPPTLPFSHSLDVSLLSFFCLHNYFCPSSLAHTYTLFQHGLLGAILVPSGMSSFLSGNFLFPQELVWLCRKQSPPNSDWHKMHFLATEAPFFLVSCTHGGELGDVLISGTQGSVAPPSGSPAKCGRRRSKGALV